MKKLLFTVLVSLSLSPIAVNAQDMGYNDTKALYLNINTGIASGYSFNNNPENPSGAATNNYSLGANIGYKFNPYFATEIGYNNLWLPSTTEDPSGQVGVEDIAVKGNIPLGDIFSLYGRLGVAGYQNIGGAPSGGNFANNLGVLYGAGTQWAINENFALRLEDWSVTGLGENIIQVGAEFSF